MCVYAWWNAGTCLLPQDLAILIPCALAVFSSLFGIGKTTQYSRNVESGCEITVTTAEANMFPFMGCFVSAVLASIWLLKSF